MGSPVRNPGIRGRATAEASPVLNPGPGGFGIDSTVPYLLEKEKGNGATQSLVVCLFGPSRSFTIVQTHPDFDGRVYSAPQLVHDAAKQCCAI